MSDAKQTPWATPQMKEPNNDVKVEVYGGKSQYD
jgi:hypothetical protein